MVVELKYTYLVDADIHGSVEVIDPSSHRKLCIFKNVFQFNRTISHYKQRERQRARKREKKRERR